MLTAPIPVDEPRRLAELEDLELMDSRPDEAFDRVTSQLAEVFDAASVTMSLIDSDRQFIKSAAGFGAEALTDRIFARHNSVCGHVVGKNELLVVEDLAADPRFRDCPAVTQKGLRFYAGAPLRTSGGHAIGTLAIVDTKPRKMSDRELQLLKMVADGLMTEIKLRAASQKLLVRTRTIEEDLAAARAVQRFLLPPQKQRGDGFVLWHYYHPFSLIGGDFLDARLRSDGSLALLLADVSGHGASAALTSAMVKMVFQRAAADAAGPAELLSAIQLELGGAIENGQFITAAALVFDPKARHALLASAGHPFPILLRDGLAKVVRTANELPLLIEPDRSYFNHTTLPLEHGDRLLFYTDGATEASDSSGERLGVEGLLPMVQCRGAASGQAFLLDLFRDIRLYADGKLSDDVALVSLEIAPSAQ